MSFRPLLHPRALRAAGAWALGAIVALGIAAGLAAPPFLNDASAQGLRRGRPIEGEILVKFECGEAKARVDMAKAELQGARLQHEAKLRLQGLKSASELDVELAATAVDKARGQLALTQAEFDRCTIAAPFAGRVAKWHVKPHQSLSAGQPIVDLVAEGRLRLRLNLPSAWLAWLKPGHAFEVAIEETGATYPLKLERINPRVDAVSQTVEVEGAFTGDTAGLLPGMSGNARIPRSP